MTKLKKIILFSLIFLIFLLIFILIIGRRYYNNIYSPNVKNIESEYYIYIKTNSNFDSVINILEQSDKIIDIESFKFVAKLKKYHDKIYPGKYKITKLMSNNELINNLRSGKQSTVKLSFISVRNLDILAGKLSYFLEPDSIEFSQAFKNNNIIQEYNFKREIFMSFFIPNTYEFYWNTSVEDFIRRMNKEYENFWNESRKEKAEEIGLTQIEVSILASIVEEETNKNDEKTIIAGIYINRLNKEMLLQADPTVKFAVGDITLTRILNRHLEIDSPYNTYKYKGLPPGPICVPSISSIDAVLNAEKHNYLYFCAKPDFSGYHNFAISLSQHNIYAKQYHDALRKIKR
ncbi:MAG: endolytic transglycosylase MltG [Bacteroidales bacterium]|jgi:UPF0755 protein|nr:endolytic transglycosylase MltG [Bacteroidales bacterium]